MPRPTASAATPVPSRLGRFGCGLVGCLGATAATVALLSTLFVVGVPAAFRVWALQREVVDASELAPPSGRYVRAADVALYIQEHGPADGPPVVLIHGASAWSGTWRDTQTTLAAEGHRVIALDLPPFGFSQRPENQRYDRPAQAARILGLLDTLGVDQAALVGHSFGGGPTLEAALMAPERVTRLTLVAAAISLESAGADPGPMGWVGRTPWARETAVACTFNNPLVTRPVLIQMIHDPASASDDRVALYQQAFPVRGTTEAVGAWVPELLAPAAAWSLDRDRITAFQPPVRLIWGRQDAVTPPDQAEELDGLFPHSELIWLDGVGHVPQIERVDAFHEALVPFLALDARIPEEPE